MYVTAIPAGRTRCLLAAQCHLNRLFTTVTAFDTGDQAEFRLVVDCNVKPSIPAPVGQVRTTLPATRDAVRVGSGL